MANSKTEKKRRFGCLKFLLYFMLLTVVLILTWLACNLRSAAVDGQPLVDVSAETTHITEPLDSNGDVDYCLALQQQYSENVTPENNAMVKFVQALGPLPIKKIEVANAIAKQLGIDPLPETGNYFQEMNLWSFNENQRLEAEHWNQGRSTDEGATDEPDFEMENFDPPIGDAPKIDTRAVKNQYDFAKQQPWSTDKFPSVAKWLLDNEQPMKIVREGIERTRYFHPMVSPPPTAQLMNAEMDYVQQLREFADYLSVRAMNLLHEGDVDGCIGEIKSLYKLGTQVSSGPTIVEELVAIRFTDDVFDRLITLCDSEKADVTQLKSLLQWVQQIKVVADVEQRVNLTERYTALESVTAMGRGTSPLAGVPLQNEALWKAMSRFVDYQETLLVVNKFFDGFTKAASIDDPKQRAEAMEALGLEVNLNQRWVHDNRIKSVLMGRKSKGIWMGRFLGCALMPPIRPIIDTENGIKAKHAMLQIVIAASIFKKETGQFPNALEALVPSYLDEVPTDALTGQPFFFEVTDAGLRVRSLSWKEKFSYTNAYLMIETGLMTWEEYSSPQEVDR